MVSGRKWSVWLRWPGLMPFQDRYHKRKKKVYEKLCSKYGDGLLVEQLHRQLNGWLDCFTGSWLVVVSRCTDAQGPLPLVLRGGLTSTMWWPRSATWLSLHEIPVEVVFGHQHLVKWLSGSEYCRFFSPSLLLPGQGLLHKPHWDTLRNLT